MGDRKTGYLYYLHAWTKEGGGDEVVHLDLKCDVVEDFEFGRHHLGAVPDFGLDLFSGETIIAGSFSLYGLRGVDQMARRFDEGSDDALWDWASSALPRCFVAAREPGMWWTATSPEPMTDAALEAMALVMRAAMIFAINDVRNVIKPDVPHTTSEDIVIDIIGHSALAPPSSKGA